MSISHTGDTGGGKMGGHTALCWLLLLIVNKFKSDVDRTACLAADNKKEGKNTADIETTKTITTYLLNMLKFFNIFFS